MQYVEVFSADVLMMAYEEDDVIGVLKWGRYNALSLHDQNFDYFSSKSKCVR